MKVYVIRHGESENNLAKKWTGWADVHITEKGVEDAKKSGEIIKNITFDKIFTSDLIRTIETAQNAIPGCCYETSALVREVNVGNIANTPLAGLTEEQKKARAEKGYAAFGGESKEEFRNRIKLFMNKLEKSDYENVAVFSHGGWLCGMLNLVTDTQISREHLCCNNCTVAIFEYINNIWKLHSWINLS